MIKVAKWITSSLEKYAQVWVDEFAESLQRALDDGKLTKDDLVIDDKFDLRRKLIKSVDKSDLLRHMTDNELQKAVDMALSK